MENNENKSLIAKLKEKLHLDGLRAKSIVKGIKNGVICVGLSAAMLLNTSCFNNTNNNNNNNGNENSSETGNNNNNNNNNNQQPDYSNYSEILQYILNNNYYKQLIENAKSITPDTSYKSYYDPIPYAFLADEGYNIQEIKNGNLIAYARSFVYEDEPNNLYIACNVETEAATPYYTEYILKYKLTDKEMEEYNMLHSETLIQACFANDAVSALKEPTIVSETRCTVEAHNNLLDSVKTKMKSVCDISLSNKTLNNIILTGYDKTTQTFELLPIPHVGNTADLSGKTTIGVIPLKMRSIPITLNEDNAFIQPSNWPSFELDSDKAPAVKINNVVVYNPEAVWPWEFNYNFDETFSK